MAEVIVTVRSSLGDYTTLSAAESGEQAIRANLVSRDEQLTISCEVAGDTTAATIAGFTTDATRYIKITSASGTRHAGTFDTGKAYMSNTATTCLANSQDYTIIEYLQFTVSTGNITCITNNNTGVLIRNCILRATDTNPQILLSLINSTTVRNSLVYDSGRHGVFVNSDNVTLQNVTIADCVRHGIWNLGGSSNVICTNVLCYGNGNGAAYFDFDNSGGGMTNNVSYCASSDGTADDFGSGSGNRVSQTFTFENEAANNFKLASTDGGAYGRLRGTDPHRHVGHWRV